MKKFLSILIAVVAVFGNTLYVSAQDSLPNTSYSKMTVANKTYEGNVQGMLTLTIEFKSDGFGIVSMRVLGDKESKDVTYEQNGTKIIVHAQNGDMTFTQNENDDLITNLNGTVIKLTCQTPTNSQDRLEYVMGHTFSGDFGNGQLTLSFADNGTVKVSTYVNRQRQAENWLYTQNGSTITLTEPMGRKITLTLNGRNELKGLFTIVNVTLSLVQ